jgi:hypothetical protein
MPSEVQACHLAIQPLRHRLQAVGRCSGGAILECMLFRGTSLLAERHATRQPCLNASSFITQYSEGLPWSFSQNKHTQQQPALRIAFRSITPAAWEQPRQQSTWLCPHRAASAHTPADHTACRPTWQLQHSTATQQSTRPAPVHERHFLTLFHLLTISLV